MRKTVVFALLVAATAAGCSGRDAAEARALLGQSDAAFAQVHSVTFAARMWMTGAGQDISFAMSGGGYAGGKNDGDFYVLITSPNQPQFDGVVIVRHNGKVRANVGGTAMPEVPVGDDAGSAADFDDFSAYVKEVHVEHGRLIDGQLMTKVTGSIETSALIEGSLGGMTELASLSNSGLDVANVFGDSHFVFYLSEATKLPGRMLLDMPMKILGQKLELHMDMAWTSFDKRLRFPSLT